MIESVWFRKFDQICSGELLGHKFLVPCDPVKFLIDNYGPMEWWINPNTKGFRAIDWKNSRSWPNSLWPHWLKYYRFDGSLRREKTLQDLNEHVVIGNPFVRDIENDSDLKIE